MRLHSSAGLVFAGNFRLRVDSSECPWAALTRERDGQYDFRSVAVANVNKRQLWFAISELDGEMQGNFIFVWWNLSRQSSH